MLASNRIANFLFKPELWVVPETFHQQHAHGLKVEQLSTSYIRQKSKTIYPIDEWTGEMFDCLENRLALLEAEEWLILGFGLNVIRIKDFHKTMDGQVRRAIKAYLSPEQIQELVKNLSNHNESLLDKPVASTAWRNPDDIAYIGINAIMDFCDWDKPLKDYVSLRFKPQALQVQPTINTTHTMIEVTCKSLLPNQKWLWQ